eukprot:scaffold26691_cov108-Skeletonema_dohrnii-CCMP3373.AAC.1
MENYEDNKSDSDASSDEFDDDADVLRATIELMSISDNGGDVDNGCGTWNYKAHSQRGGEMFAGLPTQLSPPGDTTKVLYNPVDEMLHEKATAEIEQSLSKGRLKLFQVDQGQPFDESSAFAAALPWGFFEQFDKYLRAGLEEGERKDWSLEDIGAFFRVDVFMRCFNASWPLFNKLNLKLKILPTKDLEAFQRVRTALTKADIPASNRKVKVGAQLPACSFDPIIKDMIDECCNHWTELFFVRGMSYCALDDDKIPNSANIWKRHGMKLTPTKDKKLKPVFHVMALIGAGYICWTEPDVLQLRLVDMLEKAIKHVAPTNSPSQRASLAFFINRGYLQLAEKQGVEITNLIQLMEKMGVKYLGTIKDSPSFPFMIVDRNEKDVKVVGRKAVIQAYGTRTSVAAKRGGTTAKVMTHGMGKIRGARVASNIVECTSQDAFAYETECAMTRVPHELPPETELDDNPSIEMQIKHAYQEFHAGIISLTMLQRTVDWFLARCFTFTSTTLHVAINVLAAVYISTSLLRDLHSRVIKILRLNPKKVVTADNADELDDEDLPTQRLGRHRNEGEGEHGTHLGDEKCREEYWLRGKNVPQLQQLCDDHEVPYTTQPRTTKAEMAKRLAAKFREINNQTAARLRNEEIPEDDEVAQEVAQISFLQRMVPHWFMTPFSTKAGGAVEQGIANEDQVIHVLPKAVKHLSQGEFDIGKVNEYGLLARREHRYCASSPDGVFALMKKNTVGQFDFIGLCVLEMKTKGSENTTDELIRQVLNGGAWGECISGTDEFEMAVPDPSYRTQLCQHATALNLEHVMIVFSLPGAQVKKIVLVHVSAEHRVDILSLQRLLAITYMPFAYIYGALPEIPSLGKDNSKSYGYACEHYTLELHLHLWLEHTKDVLKNGTPPPCRRLIDLMFCYWNKCMGNVDLVRKVIKSREAEYGSNSGPGSLMWFIMFGYSLFNGFRFHQHALIEPRLNTFTTFKQLQVARKRYGGTFEEYLMELGTGDFFSLEALRKFYPGLKEKIDGAGPLSVAAAPGQDAVASQLDEVVMSTNLYQQIQPFLTRGHPLFDTRVDKSVNHAQGILDKQLRCILCCERCVNNKHAKRGGRYGRKTKTYCVECKVMLCTHCFGKFHEDIVELPECSKYHHLVSTHPAVSPEAEVTVPNVHRTSLLSVLFNQSVEATPSDR